MSFRQGFAIFATTFVIALSAIVAFRLSEQAMAVVVGVICGAMASIPTSILVLVALQRFSRKQGERSYPAQPPVVIVNPGNSQSSSRFPNSPYFPLPRQEVRPRDFKVIGHEGWVEPSPSGSGQRAEDEAFGG
jgi:hypothetical protein